MRYLCTYVVLLLGTCFSLSVSAQEEKGNFFSKVKSAFTADITIGTYTFKDGSVYTGEMKNRRPNGKGRTVFKNGDTYEGEYSRGKRHGYGVYTFPDGERYEGQWFNDQQHGRGVYYFVNNNRYDGLWYQDYQQGEGTMYYYNGDIYQGNWEQDKREGKVRTPGRMAHIIPALGKMTRKVEMVYWCGTMVRAMMVNGARMFVGAPVLLNMPMEINT